TGKAPGKFLPLAGVSGIAVPDRLGAGAGAAASATDISAVGIGAAAASAPLAGTAENMLNRLEKLASAPSPSAPAPLSPAASRAGAGAREERDWPRRGVERCMALPFC